MEFTYNGKIFYSENTYQLYPIHQSLSTDGVHALVLVKEETGSEIGFVYHKWQESRNYFLCVISLGERYEDMCENYMRIMEDVEETEYIETNGSSFAKVYKYYNKMWKPVTKTKKGEWKYATKEKYNFIERILEKED